MPWIGGAISAGGSVLGGLMSSGSASDAASQQAGATNNAIAAQQAALKQSRADLASYRTAGSQALSRLQELLGIGGTAGGNGGVRNSNNVSPLMQQAMDRLGVSSFVDVPPDIRNQVYAQEDQANIAPNDSNAADYGSLLKNFSANDLNNDPIYKNALDFSTTQGENAINARANAGGGYDSGATLKALARFDQGNATQYGNDAYNRYTNNQNNTFSKLSSISGLGENAAAGSGNSSMAAGNNISSLISGQGNSQAASTIAGGNAISSGINNGINAYNSNNLLSQLSAGGARATDVNGYAPGMSYMMNQLS